MPRPKLPAVYRVKPEVFVQKYQSAHEKMRSARITIAGAKKGFGISVEVKSKCSSVT